MENELSMVGNSEIRVGSVAQLPPSSSISIPGLRTGSTCIHTQTTVSEKRRKGKNPWFLFRLPPTELGRHGIPNTGPGMNVVLGIPGFSPLETVPADSILLLHARQAKTRESNLAFFVKFVMVQLVRRVGNTAFRETRSCHSCNCVSLRG